MSTEPEPKLHKRDLRRQLAEARADAQRADEARRGIQRIIDQLARERDEYRDAHRRADANRNAIAAKLDQLYGDVERLADELERDQVFLGAIVDTDHRRIDRHTAAKLREVLAQMPRPAAESHTDAPEPAGEGERHNSPNGHGGAQQADEALRNGLIERDIFVGADPVRDALDVIDALTVPAGEGLRLRGERDRALRDAQTATDALAALRTDVERIADDAERLIGLRVTPKTLTDRLRAALAGHDNPTPT